VTGPLIVGIARRGVLNDANWEQALEREHTAFKECPAKPARGEAHHQEH
jgi:hypothetical protein